MSPLETLVPVDEKSDTCLVPTSEHETSSAVSLPVRVPTGEDLTSDPRPLGKRPDQSSEDDANRQLRSRLLRH
jgi:hypothetical protein